MVRPRYNTLFTHERIVQQEKDFESVPEQWDRVGTVWGSLEPLRGEDRMTAAQVHKSITHRIRTHWRNSVSNRDRLRLRSNPSRVFYVRSSLNVNEASRENELLVSELT